MIDMPVAFPLRSVVEELFPTTANYELDIRGRRELRTISEMTRMLNAVLATSSGLVSDVTLSNPFHQNTIISRYLDEVAANKLLDPGTKLLQRKVAETLVSASGEEMDYHLRSVAFMELMHAGGIVDARGAYEVKANCQITTQAVFVMTRLALSQAVLRKHPFLRFNPAQFVLFKVHCEDLDVDGSPRVSIDGYQGV